MLNTWAVNFGILYIYMAPLLFLPAARGSLINAFLGVHYGTMIKWHRCVPTVASCFFAADKLQWLWQNIQMQILLPLPASPLISDCMACLGVTMP